MTKNLDTLEAIKTYFAINPLPLVIMNVINNFLILACFTFFAFNCINISIILFNELGHSVLYTNGTQNDANYGNDSGNNSPLNNFNNDTYTYHDNREKPNKRHYCLQIIK